MAYTGYITDTTSINDRLHTNEEKENELEDLITRRERLLKVCDNYIDEFKEKYKNYLNLFEQINLEEKKLGQEVFKDLEEVGQCQNCGDFVSQKQKWKADMTMQDGHFIDTGRWHCYYTCEKRHWKPLELEEIEFTQKSSI